MIRGILTTAALVFGACAGFVATDFMLREDAGPRHETVVVRVRQVPPLVPRPIEVIRP